MTRRMPQTDWFAVMLVQILHNRTNRRPNGGRHRNMLPGKIGLGQRSILFPMVEPAVFCLASRDSCCPVASAQPGKYNTRMHFVCTKRLERLLICRFQLRRRIAQHLGQILHKSCRFGRPGIVKRRLIAILPAPQAVKSIGQHFMCLPECVNHSVCSFADGAHIKSNRKIQILCSDSFDEIFPLMQQV